MSYDRLLFKTLMLYNNGMKKRLFLGVVTGFALSALLTPVLVQADTGSHATTTDNTTTTSKDDESLKRAARLGEYKKALKETLTNEAKARIESRCVAAQTSVKNRTDSNSKALTNRTKAYNEITSNLHALSSALVAKGVDTTTFNADLLALQTKITSFTLLNSTYQQALNDVTMLDCKSDPTAFKAALEAARSAQKAVFNSAQEIRTYIANTIKPSLKALKTASEEVK